MKRLTGEDLSWGINLHLRGAAYSELHRLFRELVFVHIRLLTAIGTGMGPSNRIGLMREEFHDSIKSRFPKENKL